MSQKILKTSLWFTALSLFASVLNFLYYPIAARLLTHAEFGEVQVGVSFVMQAAALFSSLNTLALFFAAQNKKQENVLPQLERVIILLSLVLAVLTVIFAEPLSRALQLSNPNLLYLLAVIFIVNIPAATWLGSLQGGGQFIASGAISTISSLFKIVIAVIAISLGFGAEGALFGILAGSFVILPLAYILQNNHQLHIRTTFRLPAKNDFQLFLKRPLLIVLFCSLLLLALSSTLDVIAAKILLPPETAGLYAQLSTAGKIAYFATVPLAIIAFERLIKGISRRKHIVGVFSVIVVSLTALTILCGPLIMNLFFGLEPQEYESQSFNMVCVAFASYSLTTLFAYSLISSRKIFRVSVVALASLAIPMSMLLTSDTSISSIAQAYMVSQLAVVLCAGVLQYTRVK